MVNESSFSPFSDLSCFVLYPSLAQSALEHLCASSLYYCSSTNIILYYYYHLSIRVVHNNHFCHVLRCVCGQIALKLNETELECNPFLAFPRSSRHWLAPLAGVYTCAIVNPFCFVRTQHLIIIFLMGGYWLFLLLLKL